MDKTNYLHIKNTGVQWLPTIPAHWDMMKISHMSSLKSGENITNAEMDPSGEYLVYGGNGIRGNFDSFTHDGNYVLIGRQGGFMWKYQLCFRKILGI